MGWWKCRSLNALLKDTWLRGLPALNVALVLYMSHDAISTIAAYTANTIYCIRADSRFAPSQWETALQTWQSNAVSHWLGATLESAWVLSPLTVYAAMVLIASCSWMPCIDGGRCGISDHGQMGYWSNSSGILRLQQGRGYLVVVAPTGNCHTQ